MGKKNTTGLINKTDNDMEIREFRGLITDMNGYNKMTPVEANPDRITDIDTTKYSGGENYGGQPSYLMIFCNGSFLKSRSCTEGDFLLAGGELGLSGQRFIPSKTVTIDTVAEDRNVVNYKVTFEPRVASAQPTHLEVFSDSVLNHDNGWSVHCNNGSLKLTRKEGMTMTLDPSKLFASNIVPEPETLLLGTVLKFWPRTFADLNCKDKLGSTVCIVNELMRQAKLYRRDQSRVKVDEVVQKGAGLHESCAAMVEWYRPLFPGMEFRPVVEMMAEVDREKLDRFAATIEPLLPQPKSLPGSSS